MFPLNFRRERRLAHLVGIYCKKKRDGGREERRERERGRRCGHKSIGKILISAATISPNLLLSIDL